VAARLFEALTHTEVYPGHLSPFLPQRNGFLPQHSDPLRCLSRARKLCCPTLAVRLHAECGCASRRARAHRPFPCTLFNISDTGLAHANNAGAIVYSKSAY